MMVGWVLLGEPSMECNVKTFSDLLNLPVECIHKNITWLADSYYNHYQIHKHEYKYHSNDYDFYTQDYIDPEFVKNQDRITIHVLKDFDFNGRYIWRLFYVAFDDVPFMFCSNAGREGDDYWDNAIFDESTYLKMHQYVFGSLKPHIRKGHVVNVDDNAKNFIDFYGNNLFEEFVKRD